MNNIFSLPKQVGRLKATRQNAVFKGYKRCLLSILLLGICTFGYSQTFPVLPTPNYDVDHTSVVRGSVTQSGGSGISGILVKLLSSAGNTISYTLTNNSGEYELSAKAEPDNYTLQIEYPTDGFSISSSPSSFSLSTNQVKSGMNFVLSRNENTLTVCDVHTSTLTPWGLSSSVFLTLGKPNVSSAFNSVKLFTSAVTSHPELQIVNTNSSESARVTRLEVGATVYHEAPNSSSSVNSVMEFAKNNIGGSQNLAIPPSTTYTYYDISSGKTWTSTNLLGATYNTDGSEIQIQIAASAEITSSVTGGNVAFSVATNANAGACLVYTFNNDPLPVRLVSFEVGRQQAEGVLLKWRTAQEVQSKEFQIEKSLNARDWDVIGWVPTSNMGITDTEYQFIDHQILNETMYYRLKMIDIDGSFSYSRIRSLTSEKSSAKLVFFPNPILRSTQQKLRFEEIASQIQKVEIFSLTGRMTYSIATPDTDGIDLSHLSKGLYLVKAVLINGQIQSSRLLVE